METIFQSIEILSKEKGIDPQIVFDVQDRAHLLRNQLAIAVGNALWLVDGNADKAAPAAALHRDLDDFHALGGRHARSDCFDLGCHFVLHFP